jgi:hypothetical protein
VKDRPRPNQSKDYGTPCVKCGKGGAFHVKAPVVHKFSCQLLSHIHVLQNQLAHQQRQLQSASHSNNESSRLAMHPSRVRIVSDSSEEPPPPPSKSPTFRATFHPPPAEDEKPFPDGTRVYDGKRWGKIDSSSREKIYAIRYGDGDPEWVGYDEMVELVHAADAKLNNRSESLFSEDISLPDDDDFVGRDVFKEFSHMGWFWGKVVKCSSTRQYKVAFSGNSREKLAFHQEKVRQWVLAAQSQNGFTGTNCVITGSKKPSPKRKTLDTSPSKDSMQTKKAKTPPPKRKSMDSSPPKDPIQRKKAKVDITPKTPKASQFSGSEDDISIGGDLKLSASIRGEGWDGFDRHISDSKLPTKFRDIIELMDVLFPVAEGEETFYYSLWACSSKKGWGSGYEVREALKSLKKKNGNALSWHEKSTPYVPKTKKDLASFIEVLMDLRMSPRLKDPESKKSRGINTASSISKPKKKGTGDLILSDCLALPASLQGSGWKGFHKAISANTLPSQFGQVFRLMDFFFPVAPGEKSFVDSLYDCSEAESFRAGDTIRRTLRRLKLKDPDIPGLQWHTCNKPYVPETTKDLADFMRLLMSIRKAPVLATPPRKQSGVNNIGGGRRVLLGK